MKLSMQRPKASEVTCLGRVFESEDARREYHLDLLAKKLAAGEIRNVEGFPLGNDAAILAMSDPPYYTACPNPWFTEFVEHKAADRETVEPYARKPMAVDVSIGKTDPIYKAHSYHTKVPYLAIAPSILHFTLPGDVVLDGFGGSGMTGVAGQWCGTAPAAYRHQLEAEWKAAGREAPQWGSRNVVLSDLSPAATFIAENFNVPLDVEAFTEVATGILDEVDQTLSWMYETLHSDGVSKGRVEETVWTELFSCPECAVEINFFEAAYDAAASKVRDNFTCPGCGTNLVKRQLDRKYVSSVDNATGEIVSKPKRAPALIVYRLGSKTFRKTPDDRDNALLASIADMALPSSVPTTPLPTMHMTHERARMDVVGITHIHHFFLPRAAHYIGLLWKAANEQSDVRLRGALKFWIDSQISNLSIQNRYRPEVSFPYNPMTGVYYVPSLISEASPATAFKNKLKRLISTFSNFKVTENAIVGTGSASALPLPDCSIDYVFTDPPFGENIYYADLNFLVEAWHGVVTNSKNEAIIDRHKKRDILDYQHIMQECFFEYFRVLKPGRWMTVVFSNSKASVWNAIQTSLQQAGFVVAEVNALDKNQGSYRQVTSANAVKQDLVVSCYKPNGGLEDRFSANGLTDDTAWDFTRTHLRNLAVVKRNNVGGIETIAERDPRRLFDRMVSWFVRHNTPVPLSSAEFQAGLAERFPERDGMFFLTNQIDEYDKARMQAGDPPQRDLFVDDERTAIDWLTDFLKAKPSTYQEVHPEFTQKTGAGWRKHETKPELTRLLDENFLKYDGTGPVPSQVHAYLSSNWKELRNLEKDDPQLVEKARNRWYVPDPNKQQDVEARREKAMLREFDTYKQHKGKKLKEIRLEVMRAGFKAAWSAKDYRTIIDVSAKVPDEVWQEDERLMMLHSMAETRLESER